MAKAGYALDMKPNGFGVIALAYHATAVHADPLTDNLHLVLDEDDEPTTAYLPLPSTAPVPDGLTVYTFNAEDGSGHMVTQWRGKLNLLPYPASFKYCQVRAADYTNLLLRVYSNGDMLMEETITSEEPFTLPMVDDYTTFEFEFLGTSRVYMAQVAEEIEEFV